MVSWCQALKIQFLFTKARMPEDCQKLNFQDLTTTLPSAAERAVELDDGRQFRLTKAGSLQFALKQVSLSVQHLQVALQAAAVPKRGQTFGFPKRLDQQFLLTALLGKLSIADQCVRNF